MNDFQKSKKEIIYSNKIVFDVWLQLCDFIYAFPVEYHCAEYVFSNAFEAIATFIYTSEIFISDVGGVCFQTQAELCVMVGPALLETMLSN